MNATENVESGDIRFYWWFLKTNFIHIVVYAIAMRDGDDYLYIEEHCMIRKGGRLPMTE